MTDLTRTKSIVTNHGFTEFIPHVVSWEEHLCPQCESSLGYEGHVCLTCGWRSQEWLEKRKPPVSMRVRRTLWDHYKGCYYCGGDNESLGVDHLLPRSRGGDNDIVNLVPCCRSCNSQKGTKTPEEFREYLQEKRYSLNEYQIGWLVSIGLSLRDLVRTPRVVFYGEKS